MAMKRVSASLFAALLLAGCAAKAPTTEKTATSNSAAEGPRDPVKVCWDGFEAAQWGPLTDCLEAALKTEEATLAAEMTKATTQAAQSLDKLSAEKTLAASNAQWAAYREAECDRRMAAVAGRNHPDLGELTCRIELTQKRIADFQFDAE